MRTEMKERSRLAGFGKALAALGIAGSLMVGGSGIAHAQEEGENWQEYQCSPGILGTGIACNSAPAPGPAPEDDVFQGGPLGSDSALADGLRTVLGGGFFD